MTFITKKTGILILAFLVLIGFQRTSSAGITDSEYFEPVLLCAAGGTAGALTADAGQEVLMGAIFCGAGALTGVLINSHYKSKHSSIYQQKLTDLEKQVKEFQLHQAMKAAKGEEDDFSLKVREVVPGQKLPNGEVLAPTIKERLVPPGEGIIGD